MSSIETVDNFGVLVVRKFLVLFVPYFILGNIYAAGWMYIDIKDVDSIRFTDDGFIEVIDALYFSFTTMTTLGYGEITPVSGMAKWQAISQSIIGIFFMAIVVGVSVGLGLSIYSVDGKVKSEESEKYFIDPSWFGKEKDR